MRQVLLNFRRPGRAATEQRSTSEAIVTLLLLILVGLRGGDLPEMGFYRSTPVDYELLNTFSGMAWELQFQTASRIDLLRVRELSDRILFLEDPLLAIL